MYTIVMHPNKHLTKTKIATLYRNENLVDRLKFIIPCMYEDLNLSTFVATLVYTTPYGEERSELLQMSGEIYKERWMCGYLPIDSEITKTAGEITLSLVFSDSQRVLRSGTTTISIDESDCQTSQTNSSCACCSTSIATIAEVSSYLGL